jgi:hypothetical protein
LRNERESTALRPAQGSLTALSVSVRPCRIQRYVPLACEPLQRKGPIKSLNVIPAPAILIRALDRVLAVPQGGEGAASEP